MFEYAFLQTWKVSVHGRYPLYQRPRYDTAQPILSSNDSWKPRNAPVDRNCRARSESCSVVRQSDSDRWHRAWVPTCGYVPSTKQCCAGTRDYRQQTKRGWGEVPQVRSRSAYWYTTDPATRRKIINEPPLPPGYSSST